jgi:hypothetical protein
MVGSREDGERAAKVRNNIRLEGRRAWSTLAMMAAVAAIFLGVLEFRVPLESAGIAALGVLVVWLAAVFLDGRKISPGATNNDEDMLRKTIDDQHRRWRWLYAFSFFVVAALAAVMTSAFLFSGAHRAPWSIDRMGAALSAQSLTLAFFAILAALQVCFGPGFSARSYRRALNDELTRTMQRSAATFGYILAVVAMCGLLGAAAFRPQWGLAAMPGVIAAVVILPGLYFLVLQWRAGRDG